jgi:hypothetical protein
MSAWTWTNREYNDRLRQKYFIANLTLSNSGEIGLSRPGETGAKRHQHPSLF